jgi:hypothetical protein
MTRRSTPQRILDDRAFPIRIGIVTPWNGFGQRIDVYLTWLRALGEDEYAWHSDKLYFRTLQTAGRFFANFPEVTMADSAETRSRPGRAERHMPGIKGPWRG